MNERAQSILVVPFYIFFTFGVPSIYIKITFLIIQTPLPYQLVQIPPFDYAVDGSGNEMKPKMMRKMRNEETLSLMEQWNLRLVSFLIIHVSLVKRAYFYIINQFIFIL